MKKLSFLSIAPVLLAAVAVAPFCAAQTPALDKAKLETYLRHMEAWVPQIDVAIADPAASTVLPGFSDVIVRLSYNGQGKAERYYVSADGKYLIKGLAFNVATAAPSASLPGFSEFTAPPAGSETDDEHFLISADGKSIIRGEAFSLDASPFQANLDRITLAGEPSFGPASAPVKIAVFGDFQCPYCKSEAEVMRENIPTTFADQVQVIFKDFPLESIHPWARSGSVAARCVYDSGAGSNNDAFWKFHDWIYSQQEQITTENLRTQVTGWAETANVDATALGQCIDARASEAAVNTNIAEGRSLGINATPTIFINGRMLAGAYRWEVLEQVINLELGHALEQNATPGAE